MPTFSAIVPNYNDAKRIGASLDALTSQTHPFDEIIIIDDASTDDSVTVIRSLIAGIPNARLELNQENMGVVATINRGLDLIRGDFVLLASANDTYSPRFLERCLEAMAQSPATAIICGNARFIDAHTGETMEARIPLPQVPHFVSSEQVRHMLKTSPLSFFGGGVLLKREPVLAAHRLIPQLRWHSDWFLYYIMALRYGMAITPETLVTVTLDSISYSNAAKRWPEQREVIRAMVELLPRDFPQEVEIFKRAALLPTYDIQLPIYILRHPSMYYYVTPLLCWRLLAAAALNPIKRFFPHHVRQRMRRILKL